MKITPCVVTATFVDCKELTCRVVWWVINTTVHFVPRAGAMSTSTYLSRRGRSAWASFIWLVLRSSPQQGLVSLILTRLWHTNPIPLSRATVKEKPLRSWAEVRKRRRTRHRVAGKEAVTGRTWRVTSSHWAAQSAATAQSCGFLAFPSRTTWSTRNASRLVGRGSTLFSASEKEIWEVCVCSAAEWLKAFTEPGF